MPTWAEIFEDQFLDDPAQGGGYTSFPSRFAPNPNNVYHLVKCDTCGKSGFDWRYVAARICKQCAGDQRQITAYNPGEWLRFSANRWPYKQWIEAMPKPPRKERR